jgi:hypothetical protein
MMSKSTKSFVRRSQSRAVSSKLAVTTQRLSALIATKSTPRAHSSGSLGISFHILQKDLLAAAIIEFCRPTVGMAGAETTCRKF